MQDLQTKEQETTCEGVEMHRLCDGGQVMEIKDLEDVGVVLSFEVSQQGKDKVQILMVGDGSMDHFLNTLKTAMVSYGYSVEQVTNLTRTCPQDMGQMRPSLSQPDDDELCPFGPVPSASVGHA